MPVTFKGELQEETVVPGSLVQMHSSEAGCPGVHLPKGACPHSTLKGRKSALQSRGQASSFTVQ